MDELNTIWNEASTQMYEATKQQPPNADENSNEQKKDDKRVDDADFEVVDDK